MKFSPLLIKAEELSLEEYEAFVKELWIRLVFRKFLLHLSQT